ncbi:hypothetical protein TNCV_3791981 [Trichonephila clavipes]|nr:hypothetical protein TNCV_3791981 [Trichonephila clavipes]
MSQLLFTELYIEVKELIKRLLESNKLFVRGGNPLTDRSPERQSIIFPLPPSPFSLSFSAPFEGSASASFPLLSLLLCHPSRGQHLPPSPFSLSFSAPFEGSASASFRRVKAFPLLSLSLLLCPFEGSASASFRRVKAFPLLSLSFSAPFEGSASASLGDQGSTLAALVSSGQRWERSFVMSKGRWAIQADDTMQ